VLRNRRKSQSTKKGSAKISKYNEIKRWKRKIKIEKGTYRRSRSKSRYKEAPKDRLASESRLKLIDSKIGLRGTRQNMFWPTKDQARTISKQPKGGWYRVSVNRWVAKKRKKGKLSMVERPNKKSGEEFYSSTTSPWQLGDQYWKNNSRERIIKRPAFEPTRQSEDKSYSMQPSEAGWRERPTGSEGTNQ